MSIKLHNLIAPFNFSEKFIIPSLSALIGKIRKFSDEGVNKCEVFADFDFTLTRFSANGIPGKTSVTIAQTTGKPQSRMQEVQALHDYYSPIEHSSNIDETTKAHYMHEWWHRSSSMLINDELEEKDISSLVLNSDVLLRNSINSLLSACQYYSMPFSVVSAGFGNIIEGYFREIQFESAVKVHSNFLLKDQNGKLSIRTEPYIVSIEKNKVLVGTESRPNIILLGDMISDCLIIKELQYNDSIKVGFYNWNDDKMLPGYRDVFDIIVLNDGNLYIVDMIVKIIAKELQLPELIEHLNKNV